MKREIYLIVIISVIILPLQAQVPAAFNYQAVVRNNAGEELSNQNVSFRISILQDTETGPSVYSETHNLTTNDFGLANLQIGNGSEVVGVFDPGAWGLAKHFLKLEIDPAGGSSFDHIGTSQLLAVPYAFHAQTVQEDRVDDADSDPTNELQSIDLVGTQLTLSDGGGTVTLPASGGEDNWGTQTVESDASLSGNGTSGSPLKIAQQGASSGQVLKWSGSIWQPGDDLSGMPPVWLNNGNDIYYNTGKVGIGTSTPDLDLTIEKTGHAQMNIKGAMDAIIYLDKGSSSRYSALDFKNSGNDRFWVGLLANDNFRISSQYDALKGMEINSSGNINFSGSQTVGGNISVSGNSSISGGQAVGGNISVSGKIAIGKDPSIYPLEIMGGTLSYAKFYHSASGTGSTDGLLVGTESSNTCWIWNYENGSMRFGTNNGDRLIIESGGDVGIGTTNPSHKLDVAGQLNLNKGIGTGIALRCNGAEALWYNGTYFSWGYGGTFNYFADAVAIGTTTSLSSHRLVVNGTAAKPGGGSWSSYSDIRLKDILGDYTSGLEEIVQLEPVKYRYKADNLKSLPSGTEHVGFIAQDVRKIFPESIGEDAEGYLDFNMHAINVALVNAVKELRNENLALEKKVNKLEAQLEKIESAVGIRASME